MVYISNTAKKVITTIGLIGITSCTLSAQEKYLVKAGIAYNRVDVTGLSKKCLGVETLLEWPLTGTKRLSGEWEIGLYADTRPTSDFVYSKMQTNFGLAYRFFTWDNFSMGGKLALGGSSEFYKPIESSNPSNRVALNKIIALDFEKIFKNKRGVNFSVSREIDKNIWRASLKAVLKPQSKKQSKYPWPNF